MAEFSEDQRIVIRTLAAEAATKALQTSEELPRAIDGRIAARLPLMGKVERLVGHWQAIVAIVVAIPLAGVGLKALVDRFVDQRADKIMQAVRAGLRPEIAAASDGLTKFRAGLADQLETSVDSATTKLLRFGCNRIDGPAPPPQAPGFPPCPTVAPEVEATNNARNVLEAHEQTIVFKMNNRQQAKLRLRLNPVDGLPLLRHVGVRLSVPPLLSTNALDRRDDIRLNTKDLPNTHEFVEPNSGMIALVGRIKERSDEEPLYVEFDITKHLSGTDVHALRLRADQLANAPQGSAYRGNERFFLLATVIVTHRLSRE